MRIIKDSSQGVLIVPFKAGRQLKMCVTVMVAFDLKKQNKLFDEQQMWNRIMSVSENDIPDAGLPKGRAEWLLKGHAYSGENARSVVRVGCGVAGKNKRLDIYGERQWNANNEASAPKPFMKMPVSRELACGNEMIPDKDNNNHALKPASIFYPGDIQRLRSQAVKSAGFLPLSMLNQERQCYAGTYNDAWLRSNWPGYPDDFDYRYFNVAPVDQRLSEWLPHGSRYHLVNLHPESMEITGATPTYNVRAFARHTVNMKTLFSEIILHCDTLWFFPDVNTGVTLYRGILDITDDEALDVDTLVLGLEPPESVPLKIEEYLKKCNDKNGISTSMNASSGADLQQKKAAIKLDYTRKTIQDIPKFYNFKSEQLQGNIPVPVIQLSCIGSIMASTVFDQQAGMKLPVSMDKYHFALSKQKSICCNVVSELSKADTKSGKALEQMKEEAKSNGLSGDDYSHFASSVNIFPVMGRGSGCWSDQAGYLVAKAQTGLNQKKSECDNYGLRPLSCQRYMLGYLSEAVAFNAEQWHINAPAEREYIGPGWVLPTYSDGVFISLTIRPDGLDSARGEYQVQGGSVSHWRSGSAHVTAIIAEDILSACLLAQDMDEFMQVFWISSSDEQASAVLKDHNRVILPVPDETDKKNRLEPWLSIHPDIIPWILPEGVSSLKEFFHKNINIRDWLALFLDKDKTSVNPNDMINMIKNNQVDLIRNKIDSDFLKTEKLMNEQITDDELKQKKMQALNSFRSDFQTVLSQQTVPEFKSPETISSDIKQVAARIENTIDKVKEEESCFSEAGKSVDTLNGFKEEMVALVKKNSPEQLLSSMSSKKSMDDQQYNGFRRLSRRQLEDACDKGELLHKLDLSGMDLKGIHLNGADLSGSLLQNTNLAESNLSGCILQSVIAQKVNLSGSNLEKCNFNKALLEGADLCGCHGHYAVFSSAQLSGALLSDADFSMGTFKGTLLERANLIRCILYRSNLQGVMAMNADFTLADLRQCCMKDCILNNAVLIQADLQQAHGEKASFWGVNGREVNLTKAELPNARFGPAQLQNACLREADLFRISFMEADLSEAVFELANLDEAFINQTDLSKANLHNAELKRGQLIRSNLTGACLRGANLMQSALIKTRFIAADLSESCLFNADIRKITLGNTDLEKINIKKTILAGKMQGLQEVNHGNG